MSISEYNYEAYFLDYHEGKLDAAATQELMDFIARHPELKEEFESFEEIKLTNNFDEITFEQKESLKKAASVVNANTFDEIAAQYVDGTLNKALTAELLEFVKQNPKYEAELALYSKTKLVADSSIVFEHKDSLKRTSRRPATAYYYWSAAASVAIIAGIYLFFNTGKQPATTLALNSNHATDTTHSIVTPQQPVQHNATLNNTVAATNTDNNARQPRKHYSIKRAVNNNIAVQQAPQQNAIIAVQNNNIPVQKHDSVIVPIHNLVANSPKDSDVNRNIVQQPVIVNPPANSDTDKTQHNSVFAFVSNTMKNVGKVIKRNFGVNKYYSKDTDKVIAYQVTLGDNRITIPLKYNAY